MVWDKTVSWIRATEWAQTQQIPADIKRGPLQAETQAKKQKSSWTKDAVWSCIEDSNPFMNEFTVDVHHTVETKLIPLFQSGLPADAVPQYKMDQWNDLVKDLGKIA